MGARCIVIGARSPWHRGHLAVVANAAPISQAGGDVSEVNVHDCLEMAKEDWERDAAR